jgi:hypothetical protein
VACLSPVRFAVWDVHFGGVDSIASRRRGTGRRLAALLTPEVMDRSGLLLEIPGGIMGLSWLRQNVQALKRQYFGFQQGTARHVLVRVVPEIVGKTWRSEVIMSTDGGCSNAWFDFEVDGRRIVWLKCAGVA